MSITFKKPQPTRPGVSSAFLQSGGVRHVTATEASHLCGASHAGLWIPYRTISGKHVHRDTDGPHPFGRLRLDTPQDGRKYHQRKGTKPYAYLPHTLNQFAGQQDLVVVEGEFKAMALAEAGIAAVGIGGICLAFHEDQLVPGLREVLREGPYSRVLFLGDSDTSLIFDFSQQAVKLAKALDVPLLLPRIGLDGPAKGIDDVREKVGAEAFNVYWQKLVSQAESVRADDRAEELALRLFARESDNVIKEAATS